MKITRVGIRNVETPVRRPYIFSHGVLTSSMPERIEGSGTPAGKIHGPIGIGGSLTAFGFRHHLAQGSAHDGS